MSGDQGAARGQQPTLPARCGSVDWAAYCACPVCPAELGEPCLSLTGTVAGKRVVAFEAPAPHGGRKRRAGAA